MPKTLADCVTQSMDATERDFRAVLTPHRSLSRTGFLVLMLIMCVSCFGTGLVFLLSGAWPVFLFLGLDVLLVYVAFRLNYRSGRQFETVEVTPDLLTVTRHEPSGRSRSFAFNPFWTRVLLIEWPDGRNDLKITAQGRELSFGRFLTDDERRDFADALKGALVSAKGGPRI
jgi:uncharacterized membrane protein